MKPKSIAYRSWEHPVQQFIKRKKGILYGGRAMNINLPPIMKRYTTDFDIWTRSYKKHAYELEQELSQRRSGSYHVKHIQIPDNKKSVYRVVHTPTGQVIADFTRAPSKKQYYSKQGTQYQTLLSQKQRLEAILSNPKFKYRHEKAERDLNKINYYLRKMEF